MIYSVCFFDTFRGTLINAEVPVTPDVSVTGKSGRKIQKKKYAFNEGHLLARPRSVLSVHAGGERR